MKKIRLIRLFCLLLLTVAITSCFSVRPAAVKTNKKLFETFFLGDQGTQYFIKPLSFKDNSNNYLEMDFTFRYLNKILDSATINFSIYNREHIKAIDSLSIRNNSSSVTINNIKYLFSERSKHFYKTRFSTKIGLSDLKLLFSNSDWKISHYADHEFNYIAPSSVSKKIDRLKFGVFDLIENQAF